MSTEEDHMNVEQDETIHDDEKAPLADEEKVPLSNVGSRDELTEDRHDEKNVEDLEEEEEAVTEEVAVVKKTSKRSTSQDVGCCADCCRCLANVPCPSLVCFVFLIAMVATCCGSLMVALNRTRDVLDNPDIVPMSDALCLGVLFGMVFVATIFFLAAALTSPPNGTSIFNSNGKNLCARVFNVIVLVLLLLLIFAWTVVSVALAVPVIYIVLLHILHKSDDNACISLWHYGIVKVKEDLCGDNLKIFYEEIFEREDIMVCYSISIIAAVLVVLALVLVTICTTANYIQLRTARDCKYQPHTDETNSA